MDKALYGQEGESNFIGLMMHERKIDMAAVPIQATTTYDVFAPLSSLDPFNTAQPILIWGAFARWDLADTEADNTEIQMGGNSPAYDDLVPNTVINQGNQETIGFRVFDQGAKLQNDYGTNPHAHWVGTASSGPSAVSLPLRAIIDTTPASANPYSGAVYFYVLFSPLTEVP